MATLLARQAPQFDPSKLTPDYLYYNNAHEILSITGIFTTLALLIVLMRFYVRIFMLRVVGMDDYIMLLSMFMALGAFITFVLQTEYGLGRHNLVWTSIPGAFEAYLKLSFIQSLFFVNGISAVKVSVGLFLARLSHRTVSTRFIYGVIIFTIVFALACDGTIVFNCIPVGALWNFDLQPPPIGTGDARCLSPSTFRNIGLVNSIINIITDILFATMPIPLIIKLHLNRRVKISLIAALSLGYFASAAASVKAVLQFNFFNEPDWSVHDSFNVWAAIELNVGIVAACLPTIKPLFSSFLTTARTLTTNFRTQGGNATTRKSSSLASNAFQARRMSSKGYYKQESLKMGSVSPGMEEEQAGMAWQKDGYHVRVSAGPAEFGHGFGEAPARRGGSGGSFGSPDVSGSPGGGRASRSRDSSQSMFAVEYSEKGHIVRTTEVNVS